MAQLQYIGARYVPKFYENSLDPTSMDWESGRGYEALISGATLGFLPQASSSALGERTSLTLIED